MKGRLTSVSRAVESSHLAFSAGFLQALQGHAVLPQVDALLPEELVGQEVHDALVEVVAPQVGVAVGGFYFKDPFAHLQDGDVEGAAPQVEDRDAFFLLFLQAVGHGGGGGFVDDPEHVQARRWSRRLWWPGAGRR